MNVHTPPETPAVYNGCDFIDPYCTPAGGALAGRRSALPMDYRLGQINRFGLYPDRVISAPNWQTVLMSAKLGMGVTLVTDDVELDQPEAFFSAPGTKECCCTGNLAY